MEDEFEWERDAAQKEIEEDNDRSQVLEIPTVPFVLEQFVDVLRHVGKAFHPVAFVSSGWFSVQSWIIARSTIV